MRFWVLCLLSFGTLLAKEEKVALLFLTIDDVSHPSIWERAISQSSHPFTLYVHSKHEIKDPYFKQFRIAASASTTPEFHMKAWHLLLKEAIKDEANQKYIFLSDSCVPLRPLDEIYDEILSHNKSYVCYKEAWWGNSPQREIIQLPKEYRKYGNHEWIILDRRHAQMMVDDTTIIEMVSNVIADNEVYPTALLSVHGRLNDENIINQPTTFVHWDTPSKDGLYPYKMTEATPFEIFLLGQGKKNGCFFARKVMKSFPEDYLVTFLGF